MNSLLDVSGDAEANGGCSYARPPEADLLQLQKTNLFRLESVQRLRL
jgi:hypothetical protein